MERSLYYVLLKLGNNKYYLGESVNPLSYMSRIESGAYSTKAIKQYKYHCLEHIMKVSNESYSFIISKYGEENIITKCSNYNKNNINNTNISVNTSLCRVECSKNLSDTNVDNTLFNSQTIYVITLPYSSYLLNTINNTIDTNTSFVSSNDNNSNDEIIRYELCEDYEILGEAFVFEVQTLYILKLEEDKYYVGVTSKKLDDRIREHIEQAETAASWTKKYKFVSCVYRRPVLDKFDEDRMTIIMMLNKGISNVRGGNYVRIELRDYEVKRIKDIHMNIRHINEVCGHSDCYMKPCIYK